MKEIILKRVIGKILLLVIPVVLFYAGLYYKKYLPVLSDSISLDAKTYEISRINLKQTDVMVLGSSVALNGLNTKIFTDSIHKSYYNFAAWQLQIADDYYILKHYLAQCKPKYVILVSTMHDFTSPPNVNIPPALNLHGKLLGCAYITNFANIIELIKRKNEIDDYTKDHDRYGCLLFDKGGGVELHLNQKPFANNRWKATIGQFPNRLETPVALDSLASMMNYLKINKVKTVFVQMPYHKLFLNTKQLRDSVSAHFKKCEAIVKNYGGIYFNYHDMFFKADNSMFGDLGHLSGAGSEVFTRKFVKDLKGVIY